MTHNWHSAEVSANSPDADDHPDPSSGRTPVPTYQYACTECGHSFEQFQSFTDDALTECPTCGGRLRKVFNSVGIVFKGSGFYRNDSREAAKKDGDKAGSLAKDKGGKSDSASGGSSEAAGSAVGGKSDGGSAGSGSNKASDKGSSSSGGSSSGGSSSGGSSSGGSSSGSSGSSSGSSTAGSAA